MALELDENGNVKASTVEVPGVIRDAAGNTWTVPSDEASYDELLTDPLKLPKREPGFFYEFVRRDQVISKATEGFKPVTREEVGVDSLLTPADYGGATATYHEVHDLVLMKMPQVLADRRYRAARRLANEAVEQIGDPKKLAEAGGRRVGKHQLTRSTEPFEVEASNPNLDNFTEPKVR